MADEEFSQLPVAVGLSGLEIVPISVATGNPGTPYASKRTSVAAIAQGFLPSIPASIEFLVDGVGVVIATGVRGYLQMPFTATIIRVSLFADQTGSIQMDLWKCSYSQFDAGVTHPTAADSICAGNYPTITADTKSTDATLTGWSVGLNQYDVLAFNVRSASTVTRVTIAIECTRVIT